MPCNFDQSDLLDFANRETNFLRSWTTRCHIAVCPACAGELAAVQQFQTALRGADLLPPQPAAVQSRIAAPRRRVYAAAFAAVLIGCLFLFPVLHQGRSNVQNPGAAIAAALGRVNTWHFVGWKQIDGKKVPWEVWGRRAPWLYYERVGDQVTWSDGKQRLRVFPPNPALKRPAGLLIKTSADESGASSEFLSDPAYQSFVGEQRGQTVFGDGFTTLYAQTAAVAKFRRQNYQGMSGINENKLYTISKRDWLPMTYQLRFENPKIARDTEYLQVHYGDDLPDEVVAAPSPSGYSVVDFMPSVKKTVQSSGTVAESRGVRVQMTPLAWDKGGNLLVSVRGWLGGNPLTPASTFSLDVSPFDATNKLVGVGGGKTVKCLYTSNNNVRSSANILLPYEPLEPSEAASAPPKTFVLALSASPQLLVRASDLLDSAGQIHPDTRTESLVTENFRYLLPAPQTPVASLAAVLPPGTPKEFHLPTPRDYFEQRRIYYYMSYDFQADFYKKVLPRKIWQRFQNPDGSVNYYKMNSELPAQKVDRLQRIHAAEYRKAKQEFRAYAAYWQQKIVALPYKSGVTPGERENRFVHHAYDLQLLAYCYKTAGDKRNQDKTLHELLRLIKAYPDLGNLRRSTEDTLRTGRFPDYPD